MNAAIILALRPQKVVLAEIPIVIRVMGVQAQIQTAAELHVVLAISIIPVASNVRRMNMWLKRAVQAPCNLMVLVLPTVAIRIFVTDLNTHRR
tara:strand:+ start:52 stop:330 length:279 start_codon:yes stop_codon:yes gene_type:complete